ncbi:LytR C-terminal domain-containing protein [Nocardioides sp. KC13]|uniref:LytR C-terminal domain-containing protein n=1 Tax=Nocardioides turkmenicus TaxID=2711220 RepID=A0A6M1R0J1_9ACTN|nr:LytR C-terminal domain-containing protein [Nocardioides sp. KC13]NGN93490.1 LytR C-terminal domain-containing protein [Nocardioides sp. KC13]
MTGSVRPSKGERGVALPTPVIALSVVAVVAAVIVFWATGGSDDGDEKIAQAGASPSASASVKPKPAKTEAKKPAKAEPSPVDRAKVSVEVYNQSNIAGLAGDVAAKATTVGWNVVGEDNWMGSVPENTVYFPQGMKREGQQLADDLGIKRTHLSVEGSMKGDRLTVVLTGAL